MSTRIEMLTLCETDWRCCMLSPSICNDLDQFGQICTESSVSNQMKSSSSIINQNDIETLSLVVLSTAKSGSSRPADRMLIWVHKLLTISCSIAHSSHCEIIICLKLSVGVVAWLLLLLPNPAPQQNFLIYCHLS